MAESLMPGPLSPVTPPADGGSVIEQAPRRTPAGIPVAVRVGPPPELRSSADMLGLSLRIEHARLRLLRGFDELLCLDGLRGVEHLPHQIETVRKVLRYFSGRVLLADEVGLGKTIEACMLLREFLLRGLARRVLILVPAALVSQWEEELSAKFGLAFAVPDGAALQASPGYWRENDRVLASIALAKNRRNFDAVTAAAWDLVVVDEAHHCKNRATLNWKLVNGLRRRHLFLLTATPVQNNLLELYNLLTLLEPGHLKTEADFRKTYVARGNPKDPRNRERLRALLGEVMIRNTRSLVHIQLPPRYAQTFVVAPEAEESNLYKDLNAYLRSRCAGLRPQSLEEEPDSEPDDGPDPASPAANGGRDGDPGEHPLLAPLEAAAGRKGVADRTPFTRMQLNAALLAAGSHPATLLGMLERLAAADEGARPLASRARRPGHSAKEGKLLELLRGNRQGKTLVFANFLATIDRLGSTLKEAAIPYSVFTGTRTAHEKDEAVEEFQNRVPVMLCSESGGEGRNLQFANTLINFDLPWNPMRIEQRIGRIHRIGQTREVFIFNLCTADSIEERILRLLTDKIRMFELVVGEVGSILGNLDGGAEFESLVLNLWLRSRDGAELDAAFDRLGEDLLRAQEQYLDAKKLDGALFGEDYE